MVDLAVVQPGLPFSAPSWHMVENYECVYNDLLAGRGMFLCPMKYPAFPAAWYLPLQLPLPDTCLLTLRDDPRPRSNGCGRYSPLYTPAAQSCWAKNECKKGLLHILLNERAAALQLL